MDPQLRKLFHNYGDVFDDPKARSFMRVYENAAGVKGSMLLVNQANPRIDLCEWISHEDVDFQKCKRAFRHGMPVLVNARAGVNVAFGTREKSVIGSAAVLENENSIALGAFPPGFRRLGPQDAQLLESMENDFGVINIVEQTKGLLTEPAGGECFGLFADGSLAAFADIAKLRGSMFADSYSLSNIFTAQQYRKKGYAASLLKSILQAYHTKRFYYTATPATNTASVHLALQCGFVPVGEMATVQFI